MPDLIEQNKGKIDKLDVAGIHLLWDKFNDPDFCAILAKYKVHPVLFFELDSDAINYVKSELEKDALDASKEGKKRYKWRLRVLINQIINIQDIDTDFYEKYKKYANWQIAILKVDLNKDPQIINTMKKHIILSILEKVPSWNNPSTNPELDAVKSYWNLIINNNPYKEHRAFKALSLSQIEDGIDPSVYFSNE